MTELFVDEVEPGIAVVTMNRPTKLNALGSGMVDQMDDAFAELASSKHIRAVVLTGSGRAFSSGADLTEHENPRSVLSDVSSILRLQKRIASLHEKIHRLPQPVIAAVNGLAVGGGFSLALASDVRVAADSARFGAVFIGVGISACDMGTSYFLPRLIGASRAAELMLTGRIFPVEEASEIGLVVDVVDDGMVVDRALETCRRIAQHSPMGVWMTKETMWQNLDAPSLQSAIDMENRTQVMCSQTGDTLEAVTAFTEKRRPSWNPLG